MNPVSVEIGALQSYANVAVGMLMAYAPRVILAIIVLFVGLKIINTTANLIKKALQARNVEIALQTFLSDMTKWGLKALLFISVASMIGIQTTSFVAVLGAAGLAVGLALQGTLANFAGGALILLFKPFKVGSLITAQGHTGVVEEIQIFVTKLATPDNHEVILPNGPLSNGSVTNHSAKEHIRVDHSVGIAYDADLKKAKEVLLDMLRNTEHVKQDPAPFVGVTELADSSVNLVVRSFTPPANYWDVYFNTLEGTKLALDAAGIEIPFPQQVVKHLNTPS